MGDNSHSALTISQVPAADRAAAMELLWGRLDAATRDRLIESFEAEGRTFGDDYWTGLTGAYRAAELTGVAWAQWQPGRVAAIHGPRLAATEPNSTAILLLSSLTKCIGAKNVRVAQALLEIDSEPEVDWLAAAGFQHAADLSYLFCEARSFPTVQPQTTLRFEPLSAAIEARFAAVLSQTYVGSQDCPMIDGVRASEDVLAGYRATGVFDPSRWLLVSAQLEPESAMADIGCLILAEHPATQQWELVYMGITPPARGRGWGLQIVRQAQWLAHEAAIPRMVLAVDGANEPAITMYSAAGFQAWDRRVAYLRVFAERGAGSEHQGLLL